MLSVTISLTLSYKYNKALTCVTCFQSSDNKALTCEGRMGTDL
ncbi:hypothetical protein ACOMHN_060615 [Nucella lapillus]